jgi:hypothetical protein
LQNIGTYQAGKGRVEFVPRRFVREGRLEMRPQLENFPREIKPDGAVVPFDDVQWPDNVAINGVVRQAKPLLPKAERVGTLNVSYNGYRGRCFHQPRKPVIQLFRK